MVGAILTQNTAWTNVEKAIANLKRGRLLHPKKLLRLPPERLAALIQPAGYFNVKTKRLRNFLKFLTNGYHGRVATMKRRPWPALRQELLAVNGIGPETADSILLYALGKPVFVIDAYTKRILSRHYLAKKETSYEDLQRFFMQNLTARGAGIYSPPRGSLEGGGSPAKAGRRKGGTLSKKGSPLRVEPDVSFYNEYHAQLVNIGKDFCRSKPRCDRCPLNGLNW